MKSEADTGSVVVNFRFERESTGALRFEEVDEHDQPLDQAGAVVGKLYVRKASLKGSRPLRVRATLEFLDD